MIKNEMRISLKLLNSYTKQEFSHISNIIIINYEPLINEKLSFFVETNRVVSFSERTSISNYMKSVFNTFGYNTDCNVIISDVES